MFPAHDTAVKTACHEDKVRGLGAVWRDGHGDRVPGKGERPKSTLAVASRAWLVLIVVLLALSTLAHLVLHDAKIQSALSQLPLACQLFSLLHLHHLHPAALWPLSSLTSLTSQLQLQLQLTAHDELICPLPPFALSPPTSRVLTMGLAEHTSRVVSEFDFSDEDLNRHVQEYLRQTNEGLKADGTSLSQIPSYVTAVPNGTESGIYLAVDLGGTNFRVCSVSLNGDSTFNLTYNKVAIPKNLMVAKTARDLFAFLAKQIELFLREHHKEHFEGATSRRNTTSFPEGYHDEQIFRLGFTFSFPVQQLGINKGNLIRWTKGFDIPDAIGKDVCKLLQDEIDRLGLPVKVAALVNDTVGTLMARSYTSSGKHRSLLGAIFGTGTNGAYIEKTSNITKPIKGEYDTSTGEMVINTEWGSFDNQLNVLPSTVWDTALDRDSVNPGIQMYEKRVSGMFLGEIVRLAVADMMKDDETSLFRDTNSSTNDWSTTTNLGPKSGLLFQWGLDTAVLSVAAADNTPELVAVRQELENTLQVYTPSLEDAQAFKAVAGAVVRRAARLSAVAIGAIVLQSGKLNDPAEEVVDIGVDGSLVEHYPFFRDMIYEALRAIDGIGPSGADKIRIGIAKDGSGVGAALIALMAQKMEKPGDFLADLRRDIKRRLSQPFESPVEESTLLSLPFLVAAGVGVGAFAAFMWSRYNTLTLRN